MVIRRVITPQRLQVIGELYFLSETREVARNAVVLEITSTMKDLGVWKKRSDDPEVHAVTLH